MVTHQNTSGSTVSQEIIRFVQVEREKIDRLRYGTHHIEIINGHLHNWNMAQDHQRGKEIDFLEGSYPYRD